MASNKYDNNGQSSGSGGNNGNGENGANIANTGNTPGSPNLSASLIMILRFVRDGEHFGDVVGANIADLIQRRNHARRNVRRSRRNIRRRSIYTQPSLRNAIQDRRPTNMSSNASLLLRNAVVQRRWSNYDIAITPYAYYFVVRRPSNLLNDGAPLGNAVDEPRPVNLPNNALIPPPPPRPNAILGGRVLIVIIRLPNRNNGHETSSDGDKF